MDQCRARSSLIYVDIDIVDDFSRTPTSNQQDEAQMNRWYLPLFLTLVESDLLTSQTIT